MNAVVNDIALNVNDDREIDVTYNTLRHQINTLKANIDERVFACLDSVLHHKKFQTLEASWRGLEYLSEKIENFKGEIKVKILDISEKLLDMDITNNVEFDQSVCFKKIYTEELDLPGGEPFGLLLGDYSFSLDSINQKPIDSIHIIKELSRISAAAFSPFITAADPDLFGLEDFTKLNKLNPKHIFNVKDYKRWHKLRKLEETQFFAMLLPKVVMRKPYQLGSLDKNLPDYIEKTREKKHYLWGNPVYNFAEIICRTFYDTGWFAQIYGMRADSHTGGFSNGITRLDHQHSRTMAVPKIRTEIVINKSLEKILNDNGFIVMIDGMFSEFMMQYHTPSFHISKRYMTQEASENAATSAKLPYVLCGSRFSHYLKVIMREKVGSFLSTSDCQLFLQTWLMKYCANNPDNTSSLLRYPLSRASIVVKPLLHDPAKYQCIMHLKPQYQFDGLDSDLRLINIGRY